METRDSFSGITPSNISSHGVAVLVLAVGPRPELPRDVLADLPDVGQAQLVQHLQPIRGEHEVT